MTLLIRVHTTSDLSVHAESYLFAQFIRKKVEKGETIPCKPVIKKKIFIQKVPT